MEPTVLDVDLPDRLRPGLSWPTTGVYVLVQAGLPAPARRSVVAHELSPHRRGGGVDRSGMPATWQPVVTRDEAACNRAATAELIPRSSWPAGSKSSFSPPAAGATT